MSRVEKTAYEYRCDSCGIVIDDYKSASVTMRANGEITFEWWPAGDYCGHCLADLLNGIYHAMPVADRYDQIAKPDKVAAELAVIDKERREDA